MKFFNETASEYIQIISMCLEIIGISLAYMEIRYKPLANKIEMKILIEETRFKNFAQRLLENKLFLALITIFIILVFFIEIPYMVGFFDRVVPEDWTHVKVTVIWSTFPIIILFVVSIGFILFCDFLSWLNNFSDGHAIGALGVVVTFIGLVGDAYQVITTMLIERVV